MPTFKYTALTPDGKQVKGKTDALTAVGARTGLLEQDLQVLDVKEHRSILQLEITKKRVPREEIMNLSRMLAAFIRAGVPILDGINVIGEESGNQVLQQALREVEESLRSGDPLSQALHSQPHVFPRFYVEMVRAAELTGKLDTVLDQLAIYIERETEAKRKIRSALTYPSIIFIMAVLTVVALTTFVLPRFKTFFESLDAQLPLVTRILLGFTDFLADWWYVIAAVLGGAIFGWLAFTKTPKGRAVRDRMMLKIPFVRDVVRFSTFERFCRIMASMVTAGVPLPEAMSVVSDGANNVHYRDSILHVREKMIEGEGLAQPIAGTKMFPAALTQMVRVGEDTGTLDQQLETAARFYEQELDYKIKKLTTIFEPLVIVIMGGAVGFVAIALISAMYGIFRQSGTV